MPCRISARRKKKKTKSPFAFLLLKHTHIIIGHGTNQPKFVTDLYLGLNSIAAQLERKTEKDERKYNKKRSRHVTQPIIGITDACIILIAPLSGI